MKNFLLKNKGEATLGIIAKIAGYIASIGILTGVYADMKQDVALNTNVNMEQDKKIDVIEPSIAQLQQDVSYIRGLMEAQSINQLGYNRVQEIKKASLATTTNQ